ncbi:hypothetical protein [Shewanella sp.]|uniref:hypothetical protein n=1 Tax=Shewanella sp. TaxID=50422 RepID=UPI0040540125
MENKDNSIMEIDRWLKWLKRAAYMGIGVFAVILIAYAIKFRAFYDGVKAISNLPNDWSAFGSLLSGASSLLGAVGTVGVMLLGIKQFKVQQEQIKQHKQRQDIFEKKQCDKWEKENEMLSFQKYHMHYASFQELLDNFCNDNNLKITSRNQLYRKIFPHNNFQNTYLSNDETNVDEINYLIDFYLECLNELQRLDSDKDQAILNFSHLITMRLNIEHPLESHNGDIQIRKSEGNFTFSGLNLHTIDSTMKYIGRFIISLQNFSGSQRDWLSEASYFRWDPINLVNIKDNLSQHSTRIYIDNTLYSNVLDLQSLVYKTFGNNIENTMNIVESDTAFSKYYCSITSLINSSENNKNPDELRELRHLKDQLYPHFCEIQKNIT